MRLTTTTLLFVGLLCFTSMFAQKPAAPKTLPDLIDSINTVLQKEHIAGLMLTIVTPDSVIYDQGVGLAQVNPDRPMDNSQRFRLGSISKTFAALCILQLEKEGKLKITDKLSDLAPEIPIHNQWEDTHPVRLIHFLEHTSGIDDMHFSAFYVRDGQEPTGKQLLDRHAKSLRTRWQPGTRMSYANPGYIVITYLIEKYSGMSFHDYVKKAVFDPLGMKDANFLSFPGDFSHYAFGYNYSTSKSEYVKVPFHPANAGLAGALNVGGADMARFVQMWLNEGMVDGKQVFPADMLRRMESGTTSLASQKGMKSGYGLGLYPMFFSKDFAFMGHNGGIDGFSSTFAFNRELGIGFALSINSSSADNSTVEDLVIRFITQGRAPTLPGGKVTIEAQAIAPYLGYYEYRSPRNQILYFLESITDGGKLSLQNDTLMYQLFAGKEAEKYVHAGNMQFRKIENNSPTFLLTTDAEDKPVISARGYYEKTSAFAYWTWRITFFATAIISLLILPIALIWWLVRLIRRKSKTGWQTLLLQALSILSFVVAFLILNGLLNDMHSAGELNARTIAVMLLTTLFGLLALLGLPLLWRQWQKINSKALRLYLLINGLSLVYLAGYFAIHGWIGIRLWAF